MLLLERLTGKEELGRVFEFELNRLSKKGDLNYDDILGTAATVRQEGEAEVYRYFNGVVTRFSQSPDAMRDDRRLAAYRAAVSLWFWLLTCTNERKKNVVTSLSSTMSDTHCLVRER